MVKKVAHDMEHSNMMMNIIKKLLELALRADELGIDTSGKNSTQLHQEIKRFESSSDCIEGNNGESLDAPISLSRELMVLNKNIEQYATESVASFLALKKCTRKLKSRQQMPGSSEMAAELGRMTTGIIIDLKKKQALLKSFASLLRANESAFTMHYAVLVQEIQDACSECHGILNETERQIQAFSKYAGQELLNSSPRVEKERRPLMLQRFIEYISFQSKTLSSKSKVFGNITQLNPA